MSFEKSLEDTKRKSYMKIYNAREDVKQKKIEYDNREDVIQRKKEYETKEETKQMRKEYEAKEETKQMRKEYRAREDVKQRTRENNANKPPFNCECGSTVIGGGKSKHLKTKKHLDFVDSKERE